MPKQAVFKLSAIDQAMMRIHMRFSLTFPCENSPTARAAVAARLRTSVRHAINKMPMLAGTVSEVKAASGQQQGQLEVRVTHDQLNNFQPEVKVLSQQKFPRIYESLKAANMPPKWLMSEALTPLPDNPSMNGGGPALAVQGNFIDGGFLVSLYLHHSLADFQGMSTLLRHMSNINNETSTIPTEEQLELAASQESQRRQALMGSPVTFPQDNEASPAQSEATATSDVSAANDAEVNTSRVFGFSLEKITSMKDLINKGAASEHAVSAFNTLSAILWRGVTQSRSLEGADDAVSALVVPISIRKKVEPQLDGSYYGNAAHPAFTVLPVPALRLSSDESALKGTATAIRDSINGVNNDAVQGYIGIVNGLPNVHALSGPPKMEGYNMVITTTEGIPTGEAASLGLGLGAPDYFRMIGRDHSPSFCVVLPRKKEIGAWEVHVELPADVMHNLLKNEDMMKFVKYVSE
jgi:hypothetical protein